VAAGAAAAPPIQGWYCASASQNPATTTIITKYLPATCR
jgi:hypothetical protein